MGLSGKDLDNFVSRWMYLGVWAVKLLIFWIGVSDGWQDMFFGSWRSRCWPLSPIAPLSFVLSDFPLNQVLVLSEELISPNHCRCRVGGKAQQLDIKVAPKPRQCEQHHGTKGERRLDAEFW
jgi:hypothetical protein